MVRAVKIFRKFCTNPIARDPRIKLNWYKSAVPGIAWQTELTGNDDVRLYWHKDKWCEELCYKKTRLRREPRTATAFDINFLLAILHIALSKDTNILEFHSLEKIMLACRLYVVTDHNIMALVDSIRLWQLLRVSWVGVTLPPPFESVTRVKQGYNRYIYTIKIHDAWTTRCKERGTVRVHLPLPMQSSPLNIVLWTLGLHSRKELWKNLDINEFVGKVTGKINKYPTMPLSSWLIAKEWYEKLGGTIVWHRTPYQYVFSQRGVPIPVASRTFSIVKRRRPNR